MNPTLSKQTILKKVAKPNVFTPNVETLNNKPFYLSLSHRLPLNSKRGEKMETDKEFVIDWIETRENFEVY